MEKIETMQVKIQAFALTFFPSQSSILSAMFSDRYLGNAKLAPMNSKRWGQF